MKGWSTNFAIETLSLGILCKHFKMKSFASLLRGTPFGK